MSPMTLTQKILAHHAIGLTRPWVQAGDIVTIRVDWTISSELAWNGMDRTYSLLGRPPLANRDRFFLAIDHTVDPVTLARDSRTQALVAMSRAFAKESGIRHFHDANETILHTKFYRDLVLPGDVVLGADSHTTSHGGLGAFAIGLGGADVTAAMVLGQSWIEVPEAILVEYAGQPPFGITGKDIVLHTIGELGRNTVAMEKTVEYRGDHVRTWSTDMRFTIANMTAEFGGLNGIFEPDETVADWISRRSKPGIRGGTFFRADPDARYAARYRIDLSKLGPQVALPFSPDNVAAVETVAGRELQGVFIGACTTSEEELVLGGLILEAAMQAGKRFCPTPNRLVVPGDRSIQSNLAAAGILEIYQRAGFTVDPPGCSMCLGVASRKAGRGEAWLSSQNRNYRNRMGEGSLAYLASAATVAASSVDMRIADPRPLVSCAVQERFDRILGRRTTRYSSPVTTSEPCVAIGEPPAPLRAAAKLDDRPKAEATFDAAIVGRIQRFGDNVDTDAIIPGQFNHLNDLAELGSHCFHFVRPDFAAKVRQGQTVIVAGAGWGTGSSREHAVWALQGAGVKAVIANEIAFIHKRNLVNEALPHLVVTDQAFFDLAVEDARVEIDIAAGQVRVQDRVFAARRPTSLVRSIMDAGGLVPAIRERGKAAFDLASAARQTRPEGEAALE
jgi:aconitate hydratase/homoaconitate hydratase